MKLSGADSIEEFKKVNDLTNQNYQKLHGLLLERNIVHIAMQYPTRSIAPLAEIFKDDPKIVFVENKRNFEVALKTHTFSEVFSDNIGGDIGHTTPFGHSLMADAAVPVVKEVIRGFKNFNLDKSPEIPLLSARDSH